MADKEDKKMFNRGEEKLSQFVIWDYIKSVNSMGYFDIQDFLTNSFWSIISKYKKYKTIANLIDNIYNNFFLKIVKEKTTFQ